MQGRLAVVGLAAAFGLTSLPVAATAAGGAAPTVPFPSAGNVSVIRLTLQGASTAAPRLRLANRALPAGSFVVGSTVRGSAPGRFLATIAIVNPVHGGVTTAKPGPPVDVRLPAGFRLVGAAQVARDVLYANPTPAFKLVPSPTAVVLGGKPPKLPPARILTDAQLLAFDRPVGLAEISLLGLQFVTASLSRPSPTTVRVTIGFSQLPQVNAVELRFPAQLKVVGVVKPAGTDALPMGSAVQLVASTGFYEQGVPYQFDIELSAPPKRGEFVTLRASTHYFENSLPFTERFALP